MQQRHSCKAKSFSSSQEITHIVWNLKVYHHGHKTRPCPEPEQSKHTLPSHFFKIQHTIIIPSIPHSFRFPLQNRVCTSPLSHINHMSCPSHLLDLITQVIFDDE